MLLTRNKFYSITSFVFATLLMSCTSMPINTSASKTSNSSDIQLTAEELKVAQRLMVSIRYFCEQPVEGENCLQPVTHLPQSLQDLIEQTAIAGVVLFAENIQSHQQVIQLTSDLQKAAKRSPTGEPMLIGIDQEGGRVVRLNRSDSTAFSGNMAIGATYPTKGTYYAHEVGRIIGKELNALGVNLNFSPTVDVNSNPDNPVINVRSFGEQPEMVADLGIAMMDAFQQQQVIATLKHFPGHGNTNVDSHTGLPSVNYDRSSIYQTDLLPFKKAIERSNPGMIMTAHIQYPTLDSSRIMTMSGKTIVAPATLSKKILTDILKQEFGFKGVVITDALNMAGISHHFELQQATALSLLAGADIALMPFKIRYPADVSRFKMFVRQVTQIMAESSHFSDTMQDSLNRIKTLKADFGLTKSVLKNVKVAATAKPIDEQVIAARYLLANEAHRARQKQLAYDSITLLKKQTGYFPLTESIGERILVVVQDDQQQQIINKAFDRYWPRANQSKLAIEFVQFSNFDEKLFSNKLANTDAMVLFFSETRESAVVKGELEDITRTRTQRVRLEQSRQSALEKMLAKSKAANKPIYLAGMQSPYEMRAFYAIANSVLTAYDASIYQDHLSGEFKGITYDAVVATLLGVNPVKGVLPVRLNQDEFFHQNGSQQQSSPGTK